MIKVLELFSGTGSVGKCCKELGWDVVSVDLLLPADHEVDILDFDYKQYPQDNFDIVWASPPCTEYSNLKNCWIGRKNNKTGITLTREGLEELRKESDKLIAKTLEIINYFKCELWFMENPQRGQLKDREIVKDIPFYDVSYCMYSDWGYEKRTRIWTNKKDWNNLICDKSGACGNMIEIPSNGIIKSDTEKLQAVRKHKLNVSIDVHTVGEKKRRHKKGIGLGKKQTDAGQVNVKGGGSNRLDRYRIPPDLIYSLFLD